MINEAKRIKESASVVKANDVPQYQCYYLFPMAQVAQVLMRKHGEAFRKNRFQNQIMLYILNCPHYVHDYMYEETSTEIKNFLNVLCNSYCGIAFSFEDSQCRGEFFDISIRK